jgi:hypothetical protein
MNIARDIAAEAELYGKVRAWLQRHPRVELHVSDLLQPRKAFWQRIDPKPPTDAACGFFMAGHGHHYIIESIIDPERKGAGSDSGSFQWEGLFYSPDVKEPLAEIKTTRSPYGPGKDATEDQIIEKYKDYLKQLRIYMAIEGKLVADLIIFYLYKKQKGAKAGEPQSVPEIHVYKVSISQEEIDKTLTAVRKAKARLEKALETKDHKELPLCPLWQCRDCQWKKPCDPKGTEPGKEVA